MPTSIRRWLIAWRNILFGARGFGRERRASKPGKPTVDDGGHLPRACGKGVGCASLTGARSSSGVASAALGGEGRADLLGRPVPATAIVRLRSCGCCSIAIARSEAGVRHALTGAAFAVSTDSGEDERKLGFGNAARRAAQPPGVRKAAREVVRDCWAHTADGRSGSLASGTRIAISPQARHSRAAEVTVG